MKIKNKADIAIIGGGIVGLAHAYAAVKKNLNVVVFERNQKAVGASIRNFGLIWPIGQKPGINLQRALKSREIYFELAEKAGFWLKSNGALHLAYHQDEMDVMEEFYGSSKKYGYSCELFLNDHKDLNSIIKRTGLKGAMRSSTELTVDPREVLVKLPEFLLSEHHVSLRYGHAITNLEMPYIKTVSETWEVEHAIICNGIDFETLYPETFADAAITKCKLQMMKTAAHKGLDLGPTLCAGLTLLHYDSFQHCDTLHDLKENALERYERFLKWGIHVLLAQNGSGEFIIGDSHEYGLNPEPFDKEFINQLILEYLQTFAQIPSLKITERWHGIYPKIVGRTEFIHSPEKGVTIVNGLGGAGMTLSFGLAEENIEKLFTSNFAFSYDY